MANILVYKLDGKIYINLTNKCTNDCIFCLRKDKSDVKGQELWLDSEDFSAKDVIKQLVEQLKSLKVEKFDNSLKNETTPQPFSPSTSKPNEIIFCGYGEPMLKLDILKKGLIDEFSVSLNGENSKEYDELSQPVFDNAYEEVKNFIKACSDEGIDVVASVVEGYKGRHINLEKCEKIASNLGAKFRVREWIPNGY